MAARPFLGEDLGEDPQPNRQGYEEVPGESSTGNRRRNRYCEDTIGGFFHGVFHVFCYISGQLMINAKRYDPSLPKYLVKLCFFLLWFPIVVIVLCLNLFSLAFDLYAIIECPFPNCGFIAGPYIKSIPYTDINGTFSPKSVPADDDQESYFNFQDAVITIATVSGSLSYLIMIKVLFVNYSFCHKLLKSLHINATAGIIRKLNFKTITADEYKQNYRAVTDRLILNPFLNDDDESEADDDESEADDDESEADENKAEEFKPVVLNAKQLFCFYSIFFLNFLFYASAVSILFIIVHNRVDKNFPKYALVDYVGLAAQLASQYCAIINVFIFSKVAYAATLKCAGMLKEYKGIVAPLIDPNTVNRPEQEDIIRALERKDTEYVQLCNDSMRPYRFWFSVHWFLYALTAFMSIVYFVETAIRPNCNEDVDCYLSITYVFIFALEHNILFLYPCFRAASIMEARNTLIHKVSLQEWPTRVKSSFLQFMKEQKCAFILSLICIRIEFGFNIAYISIFFGFLGIIIKIFSLS